MPEPQWRHGQKAELARKVGISPQYLSDILDGRKRATPERAQQIVKAAFDMGVALSLYDLLYPAGSSDTPEN